MHRLLVALIALGLSAAAAPAHAQKRIALLIGNQAYSAEVGALKNPHNDIALIGEALKQVGFEVLPPVWDARRSAMLGAVRQLVARLNAAGAGATGFLYYSGHGAAERATGVNYLIPVDAGEPDSTEFWDQSLKLDDVLKLLETATQAAHFVVFDACRNELKLAQRSSSKGFIPVAEQAGMFVAYSTAPGQPASDRGDRSGPYAAALAAELVKPGQDHLQLFQNVKEGVFAATQRRQVPWERNGLLTRVYFGGQMGRDPRTSNVTSSDIRATTSIALLEAYIALNIHTGEDGTRNQALARERVAELKTQRVAVGIPPAPAAPQTGCGGMAISVGSGNERRCLTPGAGGSEWFRDCATCPEMVVAPAGWFIMGSPSIEAEREPFIPGSETQRAITIRKPFAAGRFPVTRGEFAAFVAATGHTTEGNCHIWAGRDWQKQPRASWRSVDFAQTDRHPVVCVNWHGAKAYVAWLSRITGKSYRLLSDSEREYVTRAGTTTPFWWGSSITTAQANYASQGLGRGATLPVDTFAANPWGLFDVHGNVLDWAEDCQNDSSTGNPSDGSAATSGSCRHRAVRGGSWNFAPSVVRSATRGWGDAMDAYTYVGFRVARTLD